MPSRHAVPGGVSSAVRNSSGDRDEIVAGAFVFPQRVYENMCARVVAIVRGG
jgi:hypothetical protein